MNTDLSKSLQGRKSAITMCPVLTESTSWLLIFIQNFLDSSKIGTKNFRNSAQFKRPNCFKYDNQ